MIYKYQDRSYRRRRRRAGRGKIIFKIIVFFLLSYFVFIGVTKVVGSISNTSGKGIISPLGSLFTSEKDSKLASIVSSSINNSEGVYAVGIKNLQTGESYFLNADRQFQSASLYKLWVMGETFKQIDEGKFSDTAVFKESAESLNKKFDISSESAEITEGDVEMSVSDALERMITVSNNYAAHLLNSKIGLSNVKKFMTEYKQHGSDLNPPRTTVTDMVIFFEQLYNKQIIDTNASNRMLDLLSRQEINDRIPDGLPEETRVAHKTGELGKFKHDAGIVFLKDSDYIIVLLSETDDPAEAVDVEAKISKGVYLYFSNN